MNVSDFDFDLPDELVAQHAAPRGESRLLVLDRATGARHHASVAELSRYVRSGDLLVVNNTRVVAARLLGHRVPSGGAVECLLLGPARDPAPVARDPSPVARDPSPVARDPSPVAPRTSHVYEALMHPGQKLKPGARVRFEGEKGDEDALTAEVLERHFHGRRTIRLRSEGRRTIEDLIDSLGHIPLPPYIRRPDTTADRERYQTVFARERGSVAAPTAGLHFTPELLASLEANGVERVEVTLHVGYGTFKPVRVERVEDHTVDPEPYDIPAPAAVAINRALDEGRRVVCVGTTTTRAVEDAAARGDGRVLSGRGVASLFIHPGFPFRVAGALLTNFHVPRSSLLMLVAAFAGRRCVLDAYREAIDRRYRFYSYGDAMLIL